MSAAPDSIRGQLEAAVKQHAEPEVETEVGDTEVVAPVVESQQQKEERSRDDKGRFVSAGADSRSDAGVSGDAGRSGVRAETQQPVVEVEGATAGKPTAPVNPDQLPDAQPQALAPPNGWTAEAKAKWHELPAEVMAAVQKREADVAKFTSTRDEHASFGKEIYQAVSPYLAVIKAEGGTPRTAVESLLNTAYLLRTAAPEVKRQLLLDTARQYGVDLGVTAKPGQQPTAIPPEFATLQTEVASLKTQLAQYQNAGQQQLQTEVQTEIEAFAADPKHPHYESVKGHMAALIGQGLAKDLQDAYEQAVWARPDTRATLAAQQRADEEQKRRADAKQKAEAAKRKNVSVTGGPGNTAAAAAPGGRSIRDELEAARAAQSGGV
jgi:hypothetical protein